MGIHLSFQQDSKFPGVRGSVCLAELCPQRPVNVLRGTGVQSREGKADEVQKQGETPSGKQKGQSTVGLVSTGRGTLCAD